MTNGIDGPSLDRWITGNYGADQYPDESICDDCGKDRLKCGSTPEECEAEAKAEAKRIEKF